MRQTLQYRIYPTDSQRIRLESIRETCRRFYNDLLAERKEAWEARGETVTRTQQLREVKERKAINIDRDNFNDILAKAAPRLALRVPNKLTDPNSKLAVELNFKRMDDFEPENVARQVIPTSNITRICSASGTKGAGQPRSR